MGNRFLWIAVLLVALADATSAAQWAEIASPHCRCRFSMPGPPTYSSRPTGRDTKPVEQWDLETDTAAYFVAATTADQTEGALDNGVRGAWKGRKLVSEKTITLKGYPGREIVVEDQSNRRITLRLLLVNTVLYQYGVRTVKGADNAPDRTRFFESFTFDP
jgi:hypothetical protein